MNHTEWTEHKIYSGARTVFLKIMHLMFFNEVSKFNRRLISNISCSESQIVVKLKLTQIETQLRLMSKIRPIAFWKYLYTRHTQNSIGEIFKFLEYFLSMYSFLFPWTFCAIIRIMNWFFSAPRRNACFSFICFTSRFCDKGFMFMV